jgi:predicted amidohydrolase
MDQEQVMEGSVRLAVVQPRVIRPDESANVAEAVVYATQAADQGAQIIVFPECYPGPYAGPPSFSALESLSAVAQEYGVYVGYGFMEAAQEGNDPGAEQYYNVYQLLGPEGAIASTYRKMIPSPVDPELSGKHTVPGDEFTLAETPWGTVGVLICWEAWFPELCRTLAMQGADVVLFPTGGMLYHLAPVWRNLVQARATENLVYTASCVNLFGVEDGFAHICAPEGELGSLQEEGLLLADLDMARLEYLRNEDEVLGFPKFYKTIPGLWRHNRPELYQPPGQQGGKGNR